jgi:divalent metal cation (Fe/Co/Zn/Cd) transporter
MELKEQGGKMDFLRLYLGEIASLALALIIFVVAAAIASRYVMDRRMIRNVRNACIALAIAAFAVSWTYSLAVNRTPRGRIDRSAVDQDQKAFELRHSDQKK